MNLLVFSHNELPLVKGLRKQHRLVTVYPRSREGSDLVYEPERDSFEDVRQRMPRGFVPDAIILVTLEYINFLWGFHEASVPVVAPISDTNLCLDLLESSLPFVDLFVCNEERQQDLFARHGAATRYLPWFGLDPDVFQPGLSRPRWDVVFAGNLNPYIHQRRGKLLEKLLSARYGTRRVTTHVLSGVFGTDYARALARGRIVFNHSVRGEVNMRVYEAMGVGRCLLIEDTNAEVLRWFRDREHLVTYNDSNLIETIAYYLDHAEEREKIARQGHEEAIARHTGERKAEALSETLGGFLAQWPGRIAYPSDVLHRQASRVFLYQRRIDAAIRHALQALNDNDTPQNRENLAWVLGTIAHLSPSADAWERFVRAAKEAREADGRSALLVWNLLELQSNGLEPKSVRRFIEDLAEGRLGIVSGTSPLPMGYDRFRVRWDELLHEDGVGDAERQKLLIARAHELLGDAEARLGRPEAARQAYEESQSFRDDGYTDFKLAELSGREPKDVESSLKRAFAREPFFFAARANLAELKLKTKQPAEARMQAEESLRLLTEPFRSFQDRLVAVLERAARDEEETEPYTLGKPILWEGVCLTPTGVARETSLILHELLGRGLPITVDAWDRGARDIVTEPEIRRRLEATRPLPPGERFVQVCHAVPNLLKHREGACAVIHRTTFETDRLPPAWVPVLGRADQVWVVSEFNRRIFTAHGISPERLSVIPDPVTGPSTAGIEPVSILNRRGFNFLSVFSWGRRKGWDLLVRAFLSEFREDDDVSLTLRIVVLPERPQVEIQDTVREFIRKDLGRDPDRGPPILFVEETLSNAEMWGLFRQADAFVLPSRGEGFGRPYAEALVAGLPTIATRFGGQLDFLTDENSYLIDVEGLEYAEGDAPVFVGHRWARPSVEHLRCLMRQVYECPEEGRQKARGAIGEILSRFSVRRVANLIVRELNRLDGVCHGR